MEVTISLHHSTLDCEKTRMYYFLQDSKAKALVLHMGHFYLLRRDDSDKRAHSVTLDRFRKLHLISGVSWSCCGRPTSDNSSLSPKQITPIISDFESFIIICYFSSISIHRRLSTLCMGSNSKMIYDLFIFKPIWSYCNNWMILKFDSTCSHHCIFTSAGADPEIFSRGGGSYLYV